MISEKEQDVWRRARTNYTRETIGHVGWKDWKELPTETRVDYYLRAWSEDDSWLSKRTATLIGVEAVLT